MVGYPYPTTPTLQAVLGLGSLASLSDQKFTLLCSDRDIQAVLGLGRPVSLPTQSKPCYAGPAVDDLEVEVAAVVTCCMSSP